MSNRSETDPNDDLDVVSDDDTDENLRHQSSIKPEEVHPRIKFSIDSILNNTAPPKHSILNGTTSSKHSIFNRATSPNDRRHNDSIIKSYFSANSLDCATVDTTTLDISVDDDDDDVNEHANDNGDVIVKRADVEQRESIDDSERYSWLQCTRYKPPKLPRK